MELRRGTMTLPASEDKAKRWDVREYTETPTAVPVSATGFCHVSDGAPTAPNSKPIASVAVRIDRWDVTRNPNSRDVADLTLNGAVSAEAAASLHEVLRKAVGYVRLVAHSSAPIQETDTHPPIDVEQTVIGLMRSEGCGNLARLLFNSDPDIRALDLGDVSGESSNPYRVDAAARAWATEHPLRAKYEKMVRRVVEELVKP